MKKLKLFGISSEDRYNCVRFERKESFIENLNVFLEKLKLVSKSKDNTYSYNGKIYSREIYYLLFETNKKDESEVVKVPFYAFKNRHLHFTNKKIELLILFFERHIEIIFYCDEKEKKNMFTALEKFVNFKK